jgi:hypothetical protein
MVQCLIYQPRGRQARPIEGKPSIWMASTVRSKLVRAAKAAGRKSRSPSLRGGWQYTLSAQSSRKAVPAFAFLMGTNVDRIRPNSRLSHPALAQIRVRASRLWETTSVPVPYSTVESVVSGLGYRGFYHFTVSTWRCIADLLQSGWLNLTRTQYRNFIAGQGKAHSNEVRMSITNHEQESSRAWRDQKLRSPVPSVLKHNSRQEPSPWPRNASTATPIWDIGCRIMNPIPPSLWTIQRSLIN